MKEHFVSYEISKRLKDLGFDVECLTYYENDNDNGEFKLFPYYSRIKTSQVVQNIGMEQYICAPLCQQVTDWLRDVHNINVEIVYYSVYRWRLRIISPTTGVTGYTGGSKHTYKKTLEEGIIKSLDLIEGKII